MAGGLTADQLITSARVQARIPDGAEPLSDTSILEYADKASVEVILPELRRAREEYWIKSADIAIVSGTKRYRIPSRAQGGAIRQVRLIDSAGVEQRFEKVSPDVRTMFDGSAQARPEAYILEGDEIVVLPTPNASGQYTLRVRYARRLSKLVKLSQVNIISSVAGGDVTLTATPLFTSSSFVDFVQQNPQFDSLGDDFDVTNVVSNTITVTPVPTGLSAGNYVCNVGQTPVPQFPPEYQEALLTEVVVRILRHIGWTSRAVLEQQSLMQRLEYLRTLVSPRNSDDSNVVVNWRSPLRQIAWARRGY